MATAGQPARLRPPATGSVGQRLLYGAFWVQLVASQPPVGVVPAGGHCWNFAAGPSSRPPARRFSHSTRCRARAGSGSDGRLSCRCCRSARRSASRGLSAAGPVQAPPSRE